MKQRPPQIVRAVPLIDYEIERGGDGRTVTAYAATFGDPYPVVDFDGDYDEIINRAAFDRHLTGGFGRVKVMFNHGRLANGSPSDKWSQPIATPSDVKPDGRGLLTRSRYAETPAGDEALELWKSGAITAQSFRGPIVRSRRSAGVGRTVIERLDLGLIEYGPAVFATNEAAALVAIRSSLVEDRLAALDDLTPEERAELVRRLTLDAPSDAADDALVEEASDEEDAQEDAEPVVDPGSSVELLELAAAQRQRRTDS